MNTSIEGGRAEPKSFGWQVADKVATVTLQRPERKNPLSFESYAELRDMFGQLQFAEIKSGRSDRRRREFLLRR